MKRLLSSKVFPPYLCSMVEIGEQSGRLDDVMASLSEHYHREEEMARNIKSAVHLSACHAWYDDGSHLCADCKSASGF